ncbi:hypothetical protein QFC22_005649 [Naganishia vaughanmartiniae]|uniref:Uncharacterized protein n=1 Tax=Naganishia vaughanmartiniae TaxID=1424756 RepID=A0ACC2WSN6_9TREE|nr:hypothetical protein QFC22_005649 [Naganishia vaughanmartiniae]
MEEGRMGEAEAMGAAIEASNRDYLLAAAGVETEEIDMKDGQIEDPEHDAQLQQALVASRAELERRREINFRPPAIAGTSGSQARQGESSRSAM